MTKFNPAHSQDMLVVCNIYSDVAAVVVVPAVVVVTVVVVVLVGSRHCKCC